MTIKLYDSFDYREIDNITGSVVSASFDKTYDSDIRSTCTLNIVVPNKNNIINDFEKKWNNQMVELICGIYDANAGDYRNYNLGRMLMTNGSRTFNATSQTIRLSLVDLMATLTPSRGSQIGTDTYIPSTTNVNIHDALVAIVSEFATFKRNNICQFDDTLPYDLEFKNGVYPIDIIKEILDLYPYYEMFYDTDGVFTVQEIPTREDDPVDIGHEILDECIISESKDVDFTKVKNTTEVWGRDLMCDYAATACAFNVDTYNVTISTGFTELVDGETYAVIPDHDSVSGQKMKIQDTTAYNIYNMTGAEQYSLISAGAMKKDVMYSIRYTAEKFVLVGEMQVRCIVQEIQSMPSLEEQQDYKQKNNCNNVQWIVNPDSPYACTVSPTTGNILGEIKQVLSGDEYSNISTAELAYERARYENWRSCRLQDTVRIESILIPWIDVNQKIEYTSPINNEVGTWIVQSVSFDFQKWTMDVTASRFYPLYPPW